MSQPRLMLLLTSLALVQGCTSWKQRPLPSGVAPAVSSERPVRITRIDRSVIVLENPRIVGDSLIGDVGKPPQRFPLALHDVQRMEVRSVSMLRTGGVALGAGAVLYALVAVVAALAIVAVLAAASGK